MSESNKSEGGQQTTIEKCVIVGGTVAGIVLAGGVVLALVAATTTTTMGGTRSARLQWQARQAQCLAEASRAESPVDDITADEEAKP